MKLIEQLAQHFHERGTLPDDLRAHIMREFPYIKFERPLEYEVIREGKKGWVIYFPKLEKYVIATKPSARHAALTHKRKWATAIKSNALAESLAREIARNQGKCGSRLDTE